MPSAGIASATPAANAKPEAEWPDGNEVDVGIFTCRASSKRTTPRSGRGRWPANFIGMLTTNELSPTAAMPVTAARRPFLPPTAKSSAEIAMYSLAWLAELERRRSGASMGGVGVASMA